MPRNIKDAIVTLDSGTKCFGMRLGFTQYEWDQHLDHTELEHRAEWPDGEAKAFPEAE